jgi:hypothetical protein
LRIAVESDARDAVDRFAKELMPLITAGPQGVTGYAEGRPVVHPVFRYWPCLIDRQQVTAKVEIISTRGTAGASAGGSAVWNAAPEHLFTPCPPPATCPPSGVLRDLALARSGDKGTGANIGIMARDSQAYAFLRDWLTAERVAAFLDPLGVDGVQRYEWPHLEALNFVVRGILQRSLRTDAQGKALGQLLLEMPLPR